MALGKLVTTATSTQKAEIVKITDGLSVTTVRKARVAGYSGYAMHMIFAPSKVNTIKEV